MAEVHTVEVRNPSRGAVLGLSALLVLAGCGGGGGSGATTAPPAATPPPVVVTPPADERLSLSADSAKGAFELAFGLTDLGVSLSAVALEALTARLRAGGVATLTSACESGGTLSIALDDADASGGMSPADLVTVTYAACAYPGGRIDAVLRIRVGAVSNGSTEQLRRGALEIVRFVQLDGSDEVTLRGGLNFAFTATAAEDRLELDSTELVSSFAGKNDTLGAFSYRFTLQQNGGGYDNIATGTVRSESLPGTFTFTQPSTWRAQGGQWPVAGASSITGRNGASARLDQLDASVAGAIGQVSLLLDLDGNGSFEVTQVQPWSRFVDTSYFAPKLRDAQTPRPSEGSVPPVTTTPGTSPLSPPIPVPGFMPPNGPTAAAARNLGLPIVSEPGGAAYDARRNRVYLSDPFNNRVVVLSADTWLPLETIGVGSSPRGLAISSAGDELYVALAQGGAVVVVNLDTRVRRRAELETALDSTEIAQVAELRPGKLLVSAGNGAIGTIDLVDALRPRAIAGLPLLPRARFEVSADRRFAYALAEGTTGRIAKLDLAGTEPAPLFFRDLAGTDSGVLNLAGDRMVLGNGSVVDTGSVTLLERGALGGSAGRTDDRSRILLTAAPLRLLDGATLGLLQSFSGGCSSSAQSGVLALGQRGEWLVHGPAGQCVFSTTTPATAPGVDGSRALPLPPVATNRAGRVIQVATSFAEVAEDLALDDAAGLVYVSLPAQGQVAVTSLASNTVLARTTTGNEPRRLFLSGDRHWLYVALVDTGELAVIDTTTRLVAARIPLGATLGDNRIGDVVEIRPDVVVVAAHRADGAASALVEANRVAPHAPQRIGASAGYRSASLFVAPDRSRLYVADNGGAAVTVEARDLGTAGYPVVLTSRPRAPLASRFGALSPDGRRLWIGGEALATATLTRIGVLAASGWPVQPAPTGGAAVGTFYTADAGFVYGYDVDTFQRTYAVRFQCPDSVLLTPGTAIGFGFETTGRVLYSHSRDELVMVQPSTGSLCVIARQP